MTEEGRRLQAARDPATPWKKWGPYLSERQWGTVREDYSDTGNAWDYFSHDQARLRAYRWGEDGLAGISDNRQILCFALALWNGKDPIEAVRPSVVTKIPDDLHAITLRRREQRRDGREVEAVAWLFDDVPPHGVADRSNADASQKGIVLIQITVVLGRGNHVEPLALLVDMTRRFVAGHPER